MPCPVVVKTGWRLESIAQKPDGRFTLGFRAAGKSKTVISDYVVMAIPFSILRTFDYSEARFDPLKDFTIRTLHEPKTVAHGMLGQATSSRRQQL